MEQRAYFHGRAVNAVDVKGRVSLPADMRAVIEKRARAATGEPVSDRELYVAPHRDLPCLRAFDLGYEAVLFANAEETVRDLAGRERLAALEKLQGQIFGDLEKTSFDQPGRMVLPPQSRRLGGIAGTALFIGAGQIIQIWNPQTYVDHAGTDAFDRDIVLGLIAEREARA